MSHVPPWAGYVRVSHVGNRKQQPERFHSPAEQAAQIRAWGKLRKEPVVILRAELDESGGRQDRPVLTEAIEGIERGDYCGLVVAYLSRASRSVKHLLDLWERIETAGGQVVAVAENVDTSTPAGRLTRTMLGAIAEHELDLHRERFEQLRASATARGIWQRRQTPLGYTRDADTRRLVPSSSANGVREAFRKRAAGASISEIAREIGLSPAGARGLLHNRVYLGELRVGAHLNAAAHPALISEDDWLAVQDAPGARPSRAGHGPALLAGLVRCASCGHVMSRAKGGTLSYRCHRDHSGGRCPAPAAIGLVRTDRYVEPIALHELSKLKATATAHDRTLEQARKQVRETEAELTAYLEGVSAAGLTPTQYAKGARKRRDEVDVARGELAHALAQRPAAIDDGDPVKFWGELSPRHRNQLLRSLIECVLVAPVGRGKRVPVQARVRVIAHGAGLLHPYAGGGVPRPIVQVALPEVHDPVVLGMELAEEPLEGLRRGQKVPLHP